ncbi:MAG: hypothetical protein GY811_05265 [Myxococcales bacterium]|nr:hypothetical protein [Myxococcales bacterium]
MGAELARLSVGQGQERPTGSNTAAKVILGGGRLPKRIPLPIGTILLDFRQLSVIRRGGSAACAPKMSNDAGVSLDYLKELLIKGNEAADKTARSKKLASEATEKVLRPIEERVEKIAGHETRAIGGTSSAKPQFIIEYRFELPEREAWIPQLRFALENEKKKHAEIEIGVTVGQAWTDPKTEEHYPAHVRWGAFCLAGDKVKRVQGPLRIMSRKIEESLPVLSPRPVTNKTAAMLSMVGKTITIEEIDALDSFDTLADEIAADLCKLMEALTPPPVEEEEA